MDVSHFVLFTHQPVDIQVVHNFLPVVMRAARNMHVQIFAWDISLMLLGSIVGRILAQ